MPHFRNQILKYSNSIDTKMTYHISSPDMLLESEKKQFNYAFYFHGKNLSKNYMHNLILKPSALSGFCNWLGKESPY